MDNTNSKLYNISEWFRSKSKRFNIIAASAVGLVVLAALILLISVFAERAPNIINEQFDTPDAANHFQNFGTGAWKVVSGTYQLTQPSVLADGTDGNASLSINNTRFTASEWRLNVDAKAIATSSASTTPHDFSVAFDYTDAKNYYFANFSDTAGRNMNGLFKVAGGQITSLATFPRRITANQNYTIEIRKQGTVIKAYSNGDYLAKAIGVASTSVAVGLGAQMSAATFAHLTVGSKSSVTVPVPTPGPTDSCDTLTAQQIAGTQQYTFTTRTTATGGASVSGYVYNFGDNSPLVTSNQSTVTHTYTRAGTYQASVEVSFSVGGQTVVVNSRSCTTRVPTAPAPVPTPGPTGNLDKFFLPDFTGTPSCHFSSPNYTINGTVLTTKYPAGSAAPSTGAPFGGAQTCIPSSTGSQPTMALTYSVRFPVGFQFIKGGKMPGLYGGVEPFSGGSHNANGWSMRLMWRTGGAGEVYSYTANTTGYGDEYGKGSFFWQADGQWHTVTERVTINSPGQSNGTVTLAYDGKQVISQNGIDVTNRAVPVNGLFFSTFYGGHDKTWAPTANESIDFTNFSVSK